ncbi:hypothetical protein EV363DRAFT_1098218, partial [Boletus edulis]
IKTFLEVVVKYGRGRGLFGQCNAYYGMVEAQGRGTLHCHLMLWLEGNPSPQQLCDRMVDNLNFRDMVFNWLEDLIHCELPGTTEPVVCTDIGPLSEDDDVNDCRIEEPPIVKHLEKEDFWKEFQAFVTWLTIKCNWHVHTDTCFKHLKQGEPRTNANCRMCLNGETRAQTVLDDETLSIQLHRLHPWINNFNDVILFILQSNMDIKYIGSGPGVKALVYYIMDYITKSDLKIHAGVQTLEAAMKSHAAKFTDDAATSQTTRDRNLVTKCINMLMGQQEISHQQVMGYLVGGGDYYSSHEFRPFRFYEFVKGSQRNDYSRLDSIRGEDDQDNDHLLEEEVLVDISSGEVTVCSDVLDYRLRPNNAMCDSMSVWEFFERTRKV